MLGEMLEGVVTKPHRKFTTNVIIGADDLQALYCALVEIEEAILQGHRMGVTAGPDCGWSFVTDEDPSMSHDRYFEELEQWNETRKG